MRHVSAPKRIDPPNIRQLSAPFRQNRVSGADTIAYQKRELGEELLLMGKSMKHFMLSSDYTKQASVTQQKTLL